MLCGKPLGTRTSAFCTTAEACGWESAQERDQGTVAPASQAWLGKLLPLGENTLLCFFVLSSAGIQKTLNLLSIAVLEVCWGRGVMGEGASHACVRRV